MAFVTPWQALAPRDDFGLPFSNLKFSATLAAGLDISLIVPGDAKKYKAVITVEGIAQVYVAIGTAATPPGGGIFAATDSEMVPYGGVLCREVSKGEVLHFITAGTSIDVTVSFYAMGINSGV